MKLFQQMLVAPAALGLLAPLAANAEVNIKDVSSYTAPSAEVTTAQLDKELSTDKAILRGRVDGLEYKVEELAAGAFSSATKMSGQSVFTTGIIDAAFTTAQEAAGTTTDKLAMEYNFQLDLNTSFTGLDNLYAGFETGNQDQLAMDSAVNTLEGDGTTQTNEVQLHSLFYTFPVGQFSVTAGPLLDQDDVISATTSIYSDAFRLASMPYGAEGDTGAGAAISYIGDNGWNGSFNVIAENANNAASGAFTEEGSDQWTASIGYDADNYGGGAVYKDDDGTDTSFGVGVYFRPDGMPTISIAYDTLNEDNQTDSSNLLVGFDYPVGPGTASAAFQSVDTRGTTTNNYEAYYNYPVNDSIAVQGGWFVEEVANSDNTQGVVIETFFSF